LQHRRQVLHSTPLKTEDIRHTYHETELGA
jgi:hypothetical protein